MMTREQRERVGLWIRWALALALIPTIAAIDARYVKQSEYQLDRALLLRIDSTTRSTSDRVRDMYCAGKTAGCR